MQVTIDEEEYKFLRKSLKDYGLLLESLAESEEMYENIIEHSTKSVVNEFAIGSRLESLKEVKESFIKKKSNC